MIDFMELSCEDGRWMEMAVHHVQQWALVLAVFRLWILLS